MLWLNYYENGCCVQKLGKSIYLHIIPYTVYTTSLLSPLRGQDAFYNFLNWMMWCDDVDVMYDVIKSSRLIKKLNGMTNDHNKSGVKKIQEIVFIHSIKI